MVMNASPDSSMFSPANLVTLYRTMLMSRCFDDKEIILKNQNRVYFQLSSAGHEAISLATALALRPAYDWLFPHVRDRALLLHFGLTAYEQFLSSVAAHTDIISGARQMPSPWGCRRLICLRGLPANVVRALTALVCIMSLCGAWWQRAEIQAAQPVYDLLLRSGTVVDGSGAASFRADVAIKGDRIAKIERTGIAAEQAARTIDVTGLTVAPGFIDSHAHVAVKEHEYPLAENFLRQGITTLIATNHSQDQPWPLDRYAASLHIAPNVGFFAGHTWTRKQVMGLENRAPDAGELEKMKAMVDATMRQGALGLATGLEYVPATFANTEEIVELAKVAAKYGGVYVTHMRDEGPKLIEAVKETIRIAREARIPAQINHHKASGAAQYGWTKQTLALIDAARAEGLDVTHDIYPYTAFSTYSDLMFPAWALADGKDAFARRVADPATRRRMESEMRAIFPTMAGRDLASVQFRVLPADERYNGRTLADYVRGRKQAPTLANGIRALIDLQLKGGFEGIFHAMDEADVMRLLRHPWTMIETDGDLVGWGQGFPHPRSYGAFPRVLARYVREQQVLTLEEAIRRMTSLPAQQMRLRERGLLREGMFADVVVFDAGKIQDHATYTEPHRYATGVVHLLVNGAAVIHNGALTGEKPGRVLLRER